MGQGFLVIDASRSHSDTQHLVRTPLDEWSARRTDLYLTTHDTHKRQASMPPAEFEPAIPGTERSHTNALDRAANGISKVRKYVYKSLYKVTSEKIARSIFKDFLLLYYRNPQVTGVLWCRISCCIPMAGLGYTRCSTARLEFNSVR